MFDAYENEEIMLTKSEDFLTTAKDLSDIIAALPLDHDQNQKLIDAIVEHVNAGRTDAFSQGVGFTMDRLGAVAQDLPCLPC